MRALLLLFACLAGFPGTAAKSVPESASAEHVRVSWLAPEFFGTANETIAIRFRVDPHWHVYWKNPGDSGAEPKFVFSGEGATAGPIRWPRPVRIPVGHLTNIGYDEEVAFPFDVTIEPGATKVRLEAKLEWLVCKEECLPGFATIAIERPVRGTNARWAKETGLAARKWIARAAKPAAESPWKILDASSSEGRLILKVSATPLPVEAPEVFPAKAGDWGAGQPAAERTDTEFTITVPANDLKRAPEKTDLLLADRKDSWEVTDLSVRATASVGAGANAGSTEETPALWILLISAFIGGILLNLMPCVLPVLSIKLFSLAKSAPAERVGESLRYAAGVLTTFLLIGAGFLALRAGGAAVGWGFQLQSPPVILALAILFWLMGLNFFGFFEVGTSIMNSAGRFSRSGSFMTGVLSVFVAAPCTGPFMGTALGAAATLPTVPSLGIFLSLGAGLAFPFVVVCFVPALFEKLPKPGAWMERLRQILAFPLFGTVLWLLWILEMQTGSDGLFATATALLALTFAVWLGREAGWSPKHVRARRIVAWILALATIAFASRSMKETPNVPPGGTWVAYDRAKIDEARAAKRPVFVDFTAAWCITCQVNKKAVLETAAVSTLFARKNVLAMRGDWTKQDPVITKALAEFGRSSVPLYVFYAADGSAAKILPQILTISMIRELFDDPNKED